MNVLKFPYTANIFKMDNSKIGILGAGIMGCCLALELAQRGHCVDLYELASTPMTGASLNNEGKLHLGYVYAKDPIKDTHKLMIRGSLAFTRIIKKLTGQSVEALHPSEPFQYFIPNDSQLTMKEIFNHFNEVQLTIDQTINATKDQYLNVSADTHFTRNSLNIHENYFSSKYTLGSFSTEERSVSTSAVANILTEAIKNQKKINFIGNTQVISASRLTTEEVEITVKNKGRTVVKRYQCVANCLWDDKLRVDKTAGITNTGPWILRYKAMISISASSIDLRLIPSATGILGSFGDIVNHKNGTYYLSWYPLCKLADTLDGDGQKLHSRIHSLPARSVKRLLSGLPILSEMVSSITHRKFIENNILAMAKYIPSVEELLKYGTYYKLSGGVILAKGATDIDDPNSYLHQRSIIGPRAYGRYVTIDTGKYCTAPLFALEAADIITEIIL